MISHLNLEGRTGIDNVLSSSWLQKDSIARELDYSPLARRWLSRFPAIFALYSKISGAVARFVNASVVLHELRIRFSHYSSSQQGKDFQDYCTCISIYLREPLRFTEITLTKNIYFGKRLEFRRNRSLDNLSLRNHVERFDFEQQQAYLKLISEDNRSRILISYHFGDFIYAMNYIASLEATSRKRLVLSQSEASFEYYDNMQRAFGNRAASKDSQLTLAKLDLTLLSSVLRRGNCTLTLFCDLPSGYGEQVQVKFLNRYAWFPKGPAILSLTNRIPLLPVISYFDGKRHKIEVANQIEPFTLRHESLEDGVTRITQEFVNFFECFFNRFPEQWRYLPMLPSYFTQGSFTP